MTREELELAFAALELRRRRRELLFWTLRSWLAIVMLAVCTVSLPVLLVEGRIDLWHVAGAGALGTTGAFVVRRRAG